MNDIIKNDWLLVDIDGDTAHFGMCRTDDLSKLHTVKSYRTSDFATATDCFSQYAKDAGISLLGLECGIAITGVLNGDSARIQRCRWIISISGIGYLLGKKPIVINDSVAQCWFNSVHLNSFTKIGGIGTANFDMPGKWVALNYAGGLGASVMTRLSDGTVFVNESECGHMGFAPQNEMQFELTAQMMKTMGRVSYEKMLFLPDTDPVWDRLSKPYSSDDRDKNKAAVLGAFAGDITLAFTGWSGIFLSMTGGNFLDKRQNIDEFNTYFQMKDVFKSNIAVVPRYMSKSRQNNLYGIAQMMHAEHKV
jgi:glucokinase